MAWISVHESVDGPKLRNLYKNIGCSKFEALGILNFLWLWGLKNADKDGLVQFADRGDIERYLYGVGAGCSVHPERIVDALIETGWIDKIPNGIYLHDWEEWQKQWYKAKSRRESDARRKAERRRGVLDEDEPVQTALSLGPEEEVETKAPEKKPEEKTSKYSKDFEAFWSHYPRKNDKGAAYKKYMARIRDGFSPEELLLAAMEYARQCAKNKTQLEFIKHAKTFLSDTLPFTDYIRKNAVAGDAEEEQGGNPFAEFEEG